MISHVSPDDTIRHSIIDYTFVCDTHPICTAMILFILAMIHL